MLRLKMKKEIDSQLAAKAQRILNKFYPPNVAIVNVDVEFGRPKVEYLPEEARIKATPKKELVLKAKELVTVRRITAIVLVDQKFQVSQVMKRDTFAAVSGAIGYDKNRGDKIILRRVPFRLAESLPPGQAQPKPRKEFKLPFKLGGVDFNLISSSLKKLYGKIASNPIAGKVFSMVPGDRMLNKAIYGVIGFVVLLLLLKFIFRRRSDQGGYEEAPEPEAVDISQRRSGVDAGSIDDVRRAAATNPQRSASLLESWLGEEAA
jgi:flagellar biosynthesis/type III secretory pathway M-ring protein FliF/YscJ